MQLSLEVDDGRGDQPLWALLPERARAETLSVLAGMIAAGLVAEEIEAADSGREAGS